MAVLVRKTRTRTTGRVYVDRKPSTVAVFVARVLADECFLERLLFESRGAKIIQRGLIVYACGASVYLIGREIINRLGGR